MAAEAKVKISGDPKEFQKAMKSVKDAAQDAEATLIKVGAVGAVAFAGFTAGIVSTVNEARKFETIEAQFKTLTGSVLVAKDVLKDLQDFSATTPFQFEDVANAGKQLIAFGTPISDLKTRMQQLGDVSAASGAPLKEVTGIFGQIASAGKLTGERLLQLQERAIPIGPALAKTLGIAESKVKEFVSAGKVSVDQFNTAFASLSASGGFAFKGIETQSKTLDGAISTLKDNFSLLSAGIGKEFAPFAKQAVDALTNFLQKIRENEGSVKVIARVLAAGAGMAGFVTALAAGGLAISQIITGLKLLQVAFKFSRIAAIGFTTAATLGLGLVIAFLPEIIAFLKDMVQAFNAAKEQIIQTFKNLGTNLLNIGSKIGTFLKNLFTFNVAELKSSAAAVKDAVSKAIDDTFKDAKEIKQTIQIKQKTIKEKEENDASAEQQRLEEEKARSEKAAAEKLAIKQKENAELAKEEARQKDIAVQQAQLKREQVALINAGASDAVIKIKTDEISALSALASAKTAEDLAIAEASLEQLRLNAETKRQEAIAQEILKREEELALKAEFAAFDDEDRILAQEKNLELLSVEQLQRREALRAFAEEEKTAKKKAREDQLKDEIKYGKTFAAINATLNSEQVKGVQQATGQLTQLQSSRNSTLAGIGKAAAITQLTIDTAKAAMSIYAGFSTIPIIGPALGVAGAAAAIAFGAEKISNVRSARQGGVVGGSGVGDIQPMMLEAGEIVVPKALSPTFSEQFALTPDENAPKRQSEIKIGTIIGTEQYVRDNIIPAIRDANELDNANIGVS